MAWAEFRKTVKGMARRLNKKTGKWEKGSWYCMGREPDSGKVISRPVGLLSEFKTVRTEVEKIENGTVIGRPSKTLESAYNDYERSVKSRVGSPLTWISYRRGLNKLIDFLGRHKELAKITRKEIKEFRDTIADAYSVNGMFNIIGIVGAFFSYCVEEELIQGNPASKICTQYEKTKVAKYYTDEQVRTIKSCINTPGLVRIKSNWHRPREEFRDIVDVVLLTGMREGDLAKFKCSWIVDDKIYIIGGKGNKSRIVPIQEYLAPILAKYTNRGTEFVFQGWNANRIKCQWQVLYKRAKEAFDTLPRRGRFHDLRHTFANNFLRGGGDMYRLQKILGHSSIKTTIDTYGHLEAHDLVKEMGNLMTGFLDKPAKLYVA